MLALGLCDRLTLSLDPERSTGTMDLEIEGPANSPDIPTDGGNLILRAAHRVGELHPTALQQLPSGLLFKLEKHVPSQAGLGGGSSNAAAAAIVLLRALEVRWTEEDLLILLAELGSDCPFFGHVLSRSIGSDQGVPSALGYDQGQRILPQAGSLPALQLCVVTPEVGCPTGSIYGALQNPRSDLSPKPEAQRWNVWHSSRCNDLEAPALVAVPELAPWRKALSDYDANAFQLSGSGASFYGVIPDGEDPDRWFRGLLAHLKSVGLSPRFHWNGALFAL